VAGILTLSSNIVCSVTMKSLIFLLGAVSFVSAIEMHWVNSCLNDTAAVIAFVTVNANYGTTSRMCLINKNIDCKTLSYVFENVYSLNISCLQIVLKQTNVLHFLPSGLPPLSGINLHMTSEEGSAQITCPNNAESENVTTSWSMQNSEVAVFKSLIFSNCSRRLAVVNVSHVYFQDVTFR